MTYIDDWLKKIEADKSEIDRMDNDSLINLLDIFATYLNRIRRMCPSRLRDRNGISRGGSYKGIYGRLNANNHHTGRKPTRPVWVR